MNDFIKRDDAISVVEKFKEIGSVNYGSLIDMARELRELPATDVRENIHSERTIGGFGMTHWYRCKECGGDVDLGDKYCRHCGAVFKK